MSDITEVDAVTGEIIERDYTPEELADRAQLAAKPTTPPADPDADQTPPA